MKWKHWMWPLLPVIAPFFLLGVICGAVAFGALLTLELAFTGKIGPERIED
jgi:hypothetical protein